MKDKVDRELRYLGAFLFILGALGGLLCAYIPIRQAIDHEAKVGLPFKLSLGIPGLLIFGAYFALFGERGKNWLGTQDGNRTKPKLFSYVLAIGSVVAGLYLFGWVKTTIEGYGYVFPQ